MKYTTEHIQLDDLIQQVVGALKKSNLMKDYTKTKQTMLNDSDFIAYKKTFMNEKEKVEQVQQYGSYAPDLTQKKIALYRLKRKIDQLPSVTAFHYANTELQQALDEIALLLSRVISKEIKVDYGQPLLQTKEQSKQKNCSRGCHLS